MAFRKLNDGLIEIENFFTTRASEFLGTGKFIIAGGDFYLESGNIERNFNKGEFVIEIEKDYYATGSENAYFYVSGEDGILSGIFENSGDSDETDYCYWRLIAYDNYLQGYKSVDSINWINIGGSRFEVIKRHGFLVEGEKRFILKDYKVYSSPYLSIYNYPPGFRINLIDASDNLVKETTVGYDAVGKIYIDYCFNGKIQIFDNEETLVFESDTIPINYGDEYFNSSYDVILTYNGNEVTYKTALFKKYKDNVTITNISNEDYTNMKLYISPSVGNKDKITMSLDNIEYSANMAIDLASGESKDIWVDIERAADTDVRFEQFKITIV